MCRGGERRVWFSVNPSRFYEGKPVRYAWQDLMGREMPPPIPIESGARSLSSRRSRLPVQILQHKALPSFRIGRTCLLAGAILI